MLVFDLFVHFMCLMELPIPTSLIDLLTEFHMETLGCFTIEQLYQWRSVTVLWAFSARPT